MQRIEIHHNLNLHGSATNVIRYDYFDPFVAVINFFDFECESFDWIVCTFSVVNDDRLILKLSLDPELCILFARENALTCGSLAARDLLDGTWASVDFLFDLIRCGGLALQVLLALFEERELLTSSVDMILTQWFQINELQANSVDD